MSSSIGNVLFADWLTARPDAALFGAAAAPVTILDFALQPGPLDLMTLESLVGPRLMVWEGMVPPEPVRAQPAPPSPVAIAPAAAPKLPAKSFRAPPSAEDALERERALLNWCHICERMGDAFTSLRGLERPLAAEVLTEYFASKAPGTLATRASAWNLFFRYADSSGFDPASIDEAAAFKYVKHLKDTKAPPSRAASFLASCNFAFGCVGFILGPGIATSSRCAGAASMSLAESRERLQRDPLQGPWLIAAEHEIIHVDNGDGVLTESEGELLGFLVFCTHGRQRCSDAARVVTEPILDETEGPGAELCSFIEARTTGSATKTGNTAKRARLSIPLVGLSYGLSGQPWARAWLSLRQKLGLDAHADECLQRELLTSGDFGHGRIKPGQATEWLRALLLKLGVAPEELRNVGSHSCKTTLLSMAAKGGMDRDDRRTLGGHQPPNDRSVDVYSRDTLAAPLRNLAIFLAKIRKGEFDPDASRSGRWLPFIADDDQLHLKCGGCILPLSGSDVFLCECGRWTHCSPLCRILCKACSAEFCKKCVSFLDHKCTKASAVAPALLTDEFEPAPDSEDDSDLENVRMTLEDAQEVEQEAEDQSMFLKKGFSSGCDAAMPDEGVMIHRIFRTAHKANDQCGAACGIVPKDLSFTFSVDVADLQDCKLCWRPGCTPWMHAPDTDAADSDGESIFDLLVPSDAADSDGF